MAVTYDDANDPLPSRIRLWEGGAEVWYSPKIKNKPSQSYMQVDAEYAHLSLGNLAVGRVKTEGILKTTEASFHNGLGHMMSAVDWDTGVVNAAFVYGPYGEVLESLGSETDDHLRRFNGKEADQLSKLSYYGYRYYDELSLSWTQADPLYRMAPDIAYDEPRRMSLYAFSLNNPIRYLDPDGRDASGVPTKEEYKAMVSLYNSAASATTSGGRALATLKLVALSANAHNLANKANFQLGKVAFDPLPNITKLPNGESFAEGGSTDAEGNVTATDALTNPAAFTLEEAIAFAPHEDKHISDLKTDGPVEAGDVAEKHKREVKAFGAQVEAIKNLPSSPTKKKALKASKDAKNFSRQNEKKAKKKAKEKAKEKARKKPVEKRRDD